MNPARHCAKCDTKLSEGGGPLISGLCKDCTTDILRDEEGRKVSLTCNSEIRTLKGIKLWRHAGQWRAW